MEKVFKTNIYGVEIMFTTDESDESTARTVDDVKAVIAEKIEDPSFERRQKRINEEIGYGNSFPRGLGRRA